MSWGQVSHIRRQRERRGTTIKPRKGVNDTRGNVKILQQHKDTCGNDPESLGTAYIAKMAGAEKAMKKVK